MNNNKTIAEIAKEHASLNPLDDLKNYAFGNDGVCLTKAELTEIIEDAIENITDDYPEFEYAAYNLTRAKEIITSEKETNITIPEKPKTVNDTVSLCEIIVFTYES